MRDGIVGQQISRRRRSDFTPEGQSYRFEGELALGRLLGAAGAFCTF